MATGDWSYYNYGNWVDASNSYYTFDLKVTDHNGWDAPSN